MRRSLVLSVALSALLLSRGAHAQGSADDTERARTFFNAGAQAYGAAKYKDAVRSFEQAYALAPRPPVLFSLAQAERKEFLDHGDPRVLKHAVEHYTTYLEQVQSGGRRSEALEAKADLEARLARLDPQVTQASAPEEKHKPRVTVYSPTEGARASLDGGEAEELPYFADLTPGKHRVRVFAEGYFDEEQEVSGDKGIDVPVNLPLREKPALVTVVLGTSAEIYVDGRIAATAPLGSPMEVAPGVHVITVVKNGKRAFAQEVRLERGKPFVFEPKLQTSSQRTASYAILGTGAASVLLAGFTTLVTLGEQNRARDLEAVRNERNLTADELAEHNRAIDQRDAARTASIVFASVGGALLVGGGLLYFFDKPAVAVLPPRGPEPGPSPKKPETPLDVTGSLRPYPMLGPGLYGAGLSARF